MSSRIQRGYWFSCFAFWVASLVLGSSSALADGANFNRIPFVCENLLLGQQVAAPYGHVTRAALQIPRTLRYPLVTPGLDAIKAKGTQHIAFLAEHSGPFDPVLMARALSRDFHPRPIMDEEQVLTPLIGPLVRLFAGDMSALLLPSPKEIGGVTNTALTLGVIQEAAAALRRGDNLYLYPSGRLKRSANELIGNTTIVKRLLELYPEMRIVLVRQRNYWGSSASYGSVDASEVEGMNTGKIIARGLKQGILATLGNGLVLAPLLMPKRTIRLVFSEPDNFPRHGTADEINEFMERYFRGVDDNDPEVRTHVPYYFWQGTKPVVLPPNDHGPSSSELADGLGDVPPVDPAIAKTVLAILKREAQRSEELPLSSSLDQLLDSTSLVSFRMEIEAEFKIIIPEDTYFKTTYEVAAYVDRIKSGREVVDDKPYVPSEGWRNNPSSDRIVTQLPGATIPEKAFQQYLRTPDKVIAEDRLRGALTYKDLWVRSLAVAPVIEAMPGDKVALLVPASSGGPVLYLASHLAGKVPVPIPFTLKPESITEAIESLRGTLTTPGLEKIVTSRAAVKIFSRMYDLSPYMHRFVYLEDYQRTIKLNGLKAMLRLKRDPDSVLAQTRRTTDAVILFTSGSSGTPKAVPLTHENVFTNLDDIMSEAKIREDARLLISLPPFHSFGHLFQALSLVYGVPAIYHSNPQDFSEIAKLMKGYGVTAIAGMPLHMESVARKLDGVFDRMTLVVLGGASAKPDQFALLQHIFPKADIAEGYGTTETSPVISFNFPGMTRQGTVGKVVRSLEYKLVDPTTLKPVAVGDEGLLVVRGPTVMRGYLNTNADPFIEIDGVRWYDTGDIMRELPTLFPGTRNDLQFVGRAGRMIKISGEKVYKDELENTFRAFFEERRPRNEDGTLHAGDLFVIESKKADDSPLVLFSMVSVTIDEIQLLARSLNLPGVSRISEVRIVPEIPALGVGKTEYKYFQQLLEKEGQQQAVENNLSTAK
jgi:long-chain-fatty-acid--[acyl-carrier-protein] ligase